MQNNKVGIRRMWLAAAFLLGVAFCILLFFRGLNDPDEGRYSEIPREMIASGNWLEMRLMDYRYYEKPPLAYWAVAVAFKALGLQDWVARVPLLPVTLGICGAALWMALRYWPRRQALYGGLAVSTMIGIFVGMTFLLTDNFLLLWLTLIQLLIFEAFQAQTSRKKQYGCLAGAAVAIYVALLTKGLVALVIPGAIAFIWLLVEKRLPRLWQGPTWLALGIFAALTVPTLILLEQHNPDFVRVFFIEEHFSRFQGTRAIQGHEEPFWFYGPILLLLTMPWSLFGVRTVMTMRRNQAWKSDELSRYLTIWAAVVVLFFSLSTGKLMPYVMPALVPLGLLIGRWGVGEPLLDGSPADRRWWWAGAWVLPVVGLVSVVLWFIGYLDLLPDDLAVPSLWTALPFLPLAVLLILLFRVRTLRSLPGFALILSLAYFAFSLLISPLAGKGLNSRLDMSSGLFKELACQLGPEDQLVMFRHYRPSFAFYGNRIPWQYDVKNELAYGMNAEPDRPGHLRHRAALARAMKKHPASRWFVLVEKKRWDKWMEERIPYKPDLVADDQERVIVELLPLSRWSR